MEVGLTKEELLILLLVLVGEPREGGFIVLRSLVLLNRGGVLV